MPLPGLGLACVALDLPVTAAEANAGLVPIAAAQVRLAALMNMYVWLAFGQLCMVAAINHFGTGCSPVAAISCRLLSKCCARDSVMWWTDSSTLTCICVGSCASQYVLGNGGTILMLTIVYMAVTSAGSAEMMAVSSLVTYDIYKVRSLSISYRWMCVAAQAAQWSAVRYRPRQGSPTCVFTRWHGLC